MTIDPQGILAGYQKRQDELRTQLARLSSNRMMALTLLGTSIVVAMVLAASTSTRDKVPLLYSLAVLPIAIYYGHQYQRRNLALQETRRLADYYAQAVARVEGDWPGSGVNGEVFARPNHLYSRDLNLFGQGSLFELLCTCRTEIGRRFLANLLLDPPLFDEVVERQKAIRELHGRIDLREQISTLGRFNFQESTSAAFADWLALPPVPVYRWLRATAFTTSAALVLLIIGAGGLFPWTQWTLLGPWVASLLTFHLLLGLRYRDRVLVSVPPTRAVGLEIGVLRDGLKILQTQQFHSVKLQQIVKSVREGDPIIKIGRLARLIYTLTERDRDAVYAVSRALLVGTQAFLAIEKWRAQNSELLTRWLSAWGEFEALLALSGYSYEHPENTHPVFLDAEVIFEGHEMGHPLLPASACVRNDVELNDQTRFYIVSGSNMAGKSTLLRTVGLNAVLAYAGAPVPSRGLRLSLFSICASLSIIDSLQDGKSKFFAEMERVRHTIEAAAQHPVLYLIDEILSGTNSRDRRVATEAIVRTLAERSALGVLSTHDLALTEIADLASLHGANVHMGSRNGSDPLDFDFVLKPGITTESSALQIAALAGVVIFPTSADIA